LIDLTTEGLTLWKFKSEVKAAIPCQCKTPDHRAGARIIRENAERHQNRLNGCFPCAQGVDRRSPLKDCIAETSANR
jgi:hypothetical protein